MKSEAPNTRLAIDELGTDPEQKGAPSPRRALDAGGVLLALTDVDCPTAALGHSAVLADCLEANLNVLRVLPELRPFVPFWPDLDVEQTRRDDRGLAAARKTVTWCDDVLPQRLLGKQLRIRIGDFVDEAAKRAEELDAALIVLPPSTGRLGITATTLARVAARPVLVTRTFPPLAPLLAASDLEDDDFWVLQRAVELGAQLGSQVVAVHNIGWSSTPFGPASPCFATALPHPAAFETRQSRLAHATQRLKRPIMTVLANEVDPVGAMLEQARVHRATIVVGTRSRSWLERLIGGSVAAQVVNRSDRSVVVTPRIAAQPVARRIRPRE
jgi:nucleotide-binding universal stress UspA family protein